MKIGVLAILQVRMGSSRLPGKMMLPILSGKGALELMLERVRRARTLDSVVVATTTAALDDALENLCGRLNVPCFRGSEKDVLDRYYQTALAYGPVETIVRLTGDCPLHDPAILDVTVRAFFEQGVDYLSNTSPPTFPDGLDTEVLSFAALESAWREARLKSEREHVTPYIRNHPERFRMGAAVNAEDLSSLRWTLDEPCDLEFVRAVYSHLRDAPFGMADVLQLLEAHPELSEINSRIVRNEGLQKSLREDGPVG